jgi:CHAT domain-containing protein
VEYYVAPVWSAIFVLKGDGGLEVELLQGAEADLVYLAENTFSGLDDALGTDVDGWVDNVAPLVEPIVRHTEPGDLVWLVPYGPLHYLPLHAAQVDEEWLVERNPVVYSPSASVLPYCLSRRSEGHDAALVLGDSRGDLVHARHEAELVAEQLGTHALVTSAARKATVLERLREQDAFGVVHFACHGFFDREEPFRSGLLMSTDDVRSDESVLTVKDLNDTRLDADLVALSACQSGVSAHHSGDELIGLTRAIIHSGASSVMVSLWTVDDYSTALLMEEFYALLLAAPDRTSAWAKPLALRRASSP